MKQLCALLVVLLLVSAVPSQTKAPAQAKALTAPKATATPTTAENRLPVKRVVLYKNGVGYFEHATRVRGTQELNIDFTTAQLNDVLKSLTVVDMGEGRISSVRYNSIAPLGERLKGLRLPFGEQVSRDDFLTALRGARVEVRSGATSASGKLLSVDKTKKQTVKGDIVETTEIAIVSDAGEVRNFELGPGTSVRLAERDLTDEVGRYLNLIGSSRARDLRRMTITATGNGDRDVMVSYISEVPVWKSTYRIILPQKGHPMLQGWAIVDNTIGEDWKDVHLSLVAGAPQSFVQEISQPQYARRPVVALPESLQLTPQSHEATLEGEEEKAAIGGASFGGVAGGVVAPPPPPPASEAITVNGEAETVETASAGKSSRIKNLPINGRNYSTMTAITAGIARQNPEAEGKSLGDFFEYDIRQTISIGKNQSALVPILQSPIEADKVTLWSEDALPLRAVWLRNTSDQILDAGTFNILDQGSFAGEGVMEVLHPSERRLLSYAADTAVHVKSEENTEQRPYTRILIAKGIMRLTREERSSETYTIHNADTEARQVVIEHAAREGWKLSEKGTKPEESTASFHRFKVSVDGGKTEKLTVDEAHAEDTTYVLTNLNSDFVAFLTNQSRVTPAMQEAFQRILGQKQKVADLDLQMAQRNRETAEITNDQTRLRENMKALKGSAEEKVLLQRYTRQLNDQEDRLATLRKEIADLQTQRNKANSELEKMVMAVDLDEKF